VVFLTSETVNDRLYEMLQAAGAIRDRLERNDFEVALSG
jgi:hypothetical protein